MTVRLTLRDLWRDTLTDARALLPLALPVAAALVMLPAVATDLFGPPLPAPQVPAAATATKRGPAATTGAAGAASRAGIVRPGLPTAALPGLPPGLTPKILVVDLVVPGLIGLFAQLTIIRLALDRRRGVARSVGEALTAAIRAWPVVVVVLALGAVPVAAGMLLLIVPGFYVAGRLTPAAALVLDGHGPVAALEGAWALTEGNGWRVIGLTLTFLGWFVIVSFAAGLIATGAGGLLGVVGAPAVGRVAVSAIDGFVAALFAIVNAVAVATVYRQLTPRG